MEPSRITPTCFNGVDSEMSSEHKPKAFVIMPFDAEARPVYEDFIRPTLDGLGFDVSRADDLLNQQNILRDILSSIASADLLVADLTDSNSNVYYELGLAHALSKPVILLGQDIEEIPFDIRSYRLIIYDTHFARIKDAKEAFEECTRGFLTGEVTFGNPVADFLGLKVEGQRRSRRGKTNRAEEEDAPDDRGLIDHVEDLEKRYGELTDILQELGERTQRIGGLTEKAGEQIKEASSQGGAPGRNRVRKVARGLARRLEEFRVSTTDANDRYETAADAVETSLEFVLEYTGLAAEEDPAGTRERLDSELVQMSDVLGAARDGRQAFLSLYASMNEVPPLERHLSRAIAAAAKEVQRMADNIGRTEAAISRGIQVGERIRSGLGKVEGDEAREPGGAPEVNEG